MGTAYRKITQIGSIPVSEYNDFVHLVNDLLQIQGNSCLHYSAFPVGNDLKFICSIIDTELNQIYDLSHEIKDYKNAPPFIALPNRCARLKSQELAIMVTYGLTLLKNPIDQLNINSLN